MKKNIKLFALVAFALVAAGIVRAEDSFAGKWKAEFDSQVGQQKYTFEFKVDGTNVTGRAIGIRDTGSNNVAIVEAKINKDQISFVEPLKRDDNEIRIEYTGKIAGDEIKLHRKVGDFAEYDIVAKRVKDDTSSAPAKP